MRVLHTHPATWRGRTNPGAIDALQARAVEIVRAVTDNVTGLWETLREAAPAIYTRVQKARSAAQQPSSLARLLEEIAALRAAGVSQERLQLIPVELAHVIATLDGPQPVSTQELLASMQAANREAADEMLAESALALRADRDLPIGDLQRHKDETKQLIAALQVQLFNLEQVERERYRLRLVKGQH